VVDAHYRFVVVDVGAEDKRSDGSVKATSNFSKKLLRNQLDLPFPSPVAEDHNLTFVFVANGAFSQRPDLMRPYSGSVSTTDRIRNY